MTTAKKHLIEKDPWKFGSESGKARDTLMDLADKAPKNANYLFGLRVVGQLFRRAKQPTADKVLDEIESALVAAKAAKNPVEDHDKIVASLESAQAAIEPFRIGTAKEDAEDKDE